ncbi:F0F1 ATP synthase subunit delta [Pseudoxanthomonas yeongjuensis]|jgi:F-type H+-transporting ATPase subunit delta|uniref:F0F1 ATP synthase subunit delta n=1 Tax=Pseudoxanthomonas yeongjuensis TaxID=377616 RepID=UPI001391ED16|nr:F0F1 ATP synthase subunit delta [Pseudoxanthomonas yeongjuensis]KAF1716960.1 F0F1 ATP synthase subunit delta [Pseudoxanthomonas yeongjuensis]
MSQALTLARPYARAAFSMAQDENGLAGWSSALGFAAQVAADPRAASLLLNPQLSHAEAVSLLSIDGAGESFSRFLALLAENRRLAQLPEIAGLYEELKAEAERVVKATVTSATELPAGELDTIRAALKKRFGREVELGTAIDASLIGGAVIDAGDVVIDGSLKGKLSRLQAALAQ